MRGMLLLARGDISVRRVKTCSQGTHLLALASANARLCRLLQVRTRRFVSYFCLVHPVYSASSFLSHPGVSET